MAEEKKTNRRKFLTYLGGAIVVVAAAGYGISEYMKPKPSPTPTPTTPLPTTPSPTPTLTPGKTVAERALNGANELMKTLPPNTTLNVLTVPDCATDFKILIPEWERQTGVKVTISEIPWPDWYRKLMEVPVTKTSEYDVLFSTPVWRGDMADSVFRPLDDYMGKYDPEAYSGPNKILMDQYCKWGGKTYILYNDTDIETLFLRKDWLEDPKEKSDFEKRYGYPLDKPKTVDEFRDQIEFFTRPEEKKWGFAFSWKGEAFLDLFPRILSQGVLFWDDNMRPNINQPEVVKALEEMVANKKYGAPGIVDLDFARALEYMGTGQSYSTLLMTWAQAWFEDAPESKVKGKVTYSAFPGRMFKGELFRPQAQNFGWGYSVSAYSKNPELAYLFCQWNADPENEAKQFFNPGGWTDASRASHYNEALFPKIRRKNGGVYSDEWMQLQSWQMGYCFPPLSLRGAGEYAGVLDEAVTAVLKGAEKAQPALDRVAKEWEAVTERYGRDSQIQQWNALKATYGSGLKGPLGIKV